jgi:Cys-rich repeat protein
MNAGMPSGHSLPERRPDEGLKNMRATIFLAAAVMAMACGPQQVASKYLATTNASASSQSTLAVTGTNTSLDGLTLTIPAGAVDKDVMITVELDTSIVADPAAVEGTAARFEPSGLVFKKPATMKMPLKTGADSTHLIIQAQEETGMKFVIPHKDLTVSANTVTFNVMGFTTFQPSAGTVCSADSDCPSGQACVSGVCTPQTASCTSDAQCAAGQACVNGTCSVVGCTPSGEVCDGIDNDCNGLVDDGLSCNDGGMSCTADSQCAQGQACISGVCQADNDGGQPDGGLTCSTDSDCPGSQHCVSGQCIPGVVNPDAGIDGGQPDGGNSDAGITDGGITDGGVSCNTDADCGVGQVCISNICMSPSPPDGGIDAGSAPCITANDCGAGEVCVNGACQGGPPDDGGVQCGTDSDCGVGGTCCGGFCANLQSDSSNCGQCGAVCAAAQSCSTGQCH